MRKDSLVEDYFEVIDNEHKAYWLGFLMADGCILDMPLSNGTKIPRTVQIMVSLCDIEIVHNFMHDIELDKNIRYDSRVSIHGEKLEYCKVTAGSSKMCNDLIRHGCTQRKSKILKFPVTVPDNLIRHFIRGYFDGDGSVWYCERLQERKDRKNPSIQRNFRSTFQGTSDFLEGVKSNLEANGMTIGNVRKGHGDVSCIEFGARDTMIKFYHYLYDDSTIFLKRKYNKFIETFNYLNMAY